MRRFAVSTARFNTSGTAASFSEYGSAFSFCLARKGPRTHGCTAARSPTRLEAVASMPAGVMDCYAAGGPIAQAAIAVAWIGGGV